MNNPQTNARVFLSVLPLACVIAACLIWRPACLRAEADKTPAIEAIASARYDLKLGFTIPGRVAKVLIQQGEKVQAGQILMELEDREGQALVALYEVRAASDLNIRSAQAQLELAGIEERQLQELVAKNAAAPVELQRAIVKTKLAAIDVEKAKQEHLETQQQLAQAKARHAQYILKAPNTGVIDSLSVVEGDSVEALKPILRLVVIDPLWIDVPVPTPVSLGLRVGDAAVVRSSLMGFTQPMEGKILSIAEVADAGSNTRAVRVEVPNPNQLSAGSHVMVQFTRSDPTPASNLSGQ